jgi:uncharacterized protein (DUF1697 family)
MALVAFLRGVNVGGHRRFRPSLLAKQLAHYDVVNIGATGLLVAHGANKPAAFRRELLAAVPFEVELALCDGKDVLDALAEDPFAEYAGSDVVPFVSIAIDMPKKAPQRLPIDIPGSGEWFVRVLGAKHRFFFGVYRRHVKTIGFLGRLDTALGLRVTTRNWNTMRLVSRALDAARD